MGGDTSSTDDSSTVASTAGSNSSAVTSAVATSPATATEASATNTEIDAAVSKICDALLDSYPDWDVTSIGSKIEAIQPEINGNETQPPCRPSTDTNKGDNPRLSPTLVEEGQPEKLDPANYVFPPLPTDIAIRLKTLRDASPVPTSLRNRIVEWLCHDLFRYTLYPQRLYAEVSRQLVLRHSVLRDRVGTGYHSWHQSLRFKCKFERAKIEDTGGTIKEKREKFGKKRVRSDACHDKHAKRLCRKVSNVFIDGERNHTCYSTLGEKRSMAPANQEVRYDNVISRTHLAPRSATVHPSIPHLVKLKYDTLLFCGLVFVPRVFLEFKRITGVHPKKLEALAQKHVLTLLTLAGKKAEAISLDLMAKADTAPDGSWMTTLAFLLTLPRLMKEWATFMKNSAPWFSAYPVVVWNNDLEDPGQCVIQVENQILKAEHPAQAVIAAFCLHWVFNLAYHPASKAFFTALECLLGVNTTPPRGTVVKIVSNLQKAA
ncbi:unnamed protein product [Ixodes hexagonus]